MKYITGILNSLVVAAKDTKVWLKIIVLLIVAFGGATVFRQTKIKVVDCTDCNNERRELINALIGIKKDLQAAVTTSYIGGEGIIFAQRIQTAPTTKQKTQAQQYQQSQQIRKVVSKIDSILFKYKQDSINKAKTKT